jgi:hypothetical protein
VRRYIEKLGADPTAQTPCADLASVESMGLIQVIADPRTSVLQSLHALLVAELVDVDGWDLLITLAEELGQADAAEEFQMALREEENHLENVRSWVQQLTFTDLGEGESPTKPEMERH